MVITKQNLVTKQNLITKQNLDGNEPQQEMNMRIIALVLSGMLVVCLADAASAAKVVTKNGTYEGGCSGSSCLYRSGAQKSQKHMKQMKHHKAN